MLKSLLLIGAALLMLPGCSSIFTDDVMVNKEERGASFSVRRGVVLNVRDIYVPSGPRAGRGANPVQEANFLEITILLESGEEIISQREADDFFKKGDRVRVLTDQNNHLRVQHE
ncbi:MAG: hypothetical protein FWG17_04810 [Desulfovibrionaceae bacterium]|nr:hypothetical protein [Desulfovibrionaceae bacterium]